MCLEGDAMSAPTEAEIREVITTGLERTGGVDLAEEVYVALDPFIDSDKALVRAGWMDEFYPREGHPGTIWADMRASEVEELQEAMHQAIKLAEQAAIKTLVEEVVRAGVRFAEAHPDIPRGS